MDFKGKVAFVTGGASGIGLAMAKVFLAEGMRVIIADVEQAALDKAVAELKGEIHGIHLDVTDRSAVAAAADEAESIFGKIHVLCNNAGVAAGGPITDTSHGDWDWVVGVNFHGVINGLQAFVPKLMSHGEGGYIVNTASIAGLLSTPGAGIYSSTKFALVGLSEAMVDELAPHNIGVSVLCPGFVRTGIFNSSRNRPVELQGGVDTMLGKSAEEVEKMLSEDDKYYGHWAEPEEIAELTLEAMKAGQLYIFPHPELKPAVEQRFAAIMAGFDWAADRMKT